MGEKGVKEGEVDEEGWLEREEKWKKIKERGRNARRGSRNVKGDKEGDGWKIGGVGEERWEIKGRVVKKRRRGGGNRELEGVVGSGREWEGVRGKEGDEWEVNRMGGVD